MHERKSITSVLPEQARMISTFYVQKSKSNDLISVLKKFGLEDKDIESKREGYFLNHVPFPFIAELKRFPGDQRQLYTLSYNEIIVCETQHMMNNGLFGAVISEVYNLDQLPEPIVLEATDAPGRIRANGFNIVAEEQKKCCSIM
jgi:hypothetical protein